MPAWESVLAAELSTRHHVTTRKRLQRIGLSRRVVDGLCQRGRLEHIGNGVLVCPAGAATFEQRLAIACALTGGVLSFPTAGQGLGVPQDAHDERRSTSRFRADERWSPPRIGSWFTDRPTLPRSDVVRRRDGIVVTSPPRTAFDAAAWLGTNDLESLIEQGIARGNFTVPTLWAHARRLCRHGRQAAPASSRC